MNEKHLSLKKYTVEFYENSIEAKLKPKTKIEQKNEIIASFVFVFIFLAISIFFLAIKGYVYFGIIFTITVLLIITLIIEPKFERKHIEKFHFILNNDGITHIDTNDTYFIPWCEVAAYGIVNRNCISGIRSDIKRDPTQGCIYFSKKVHCEDMLRIKFDRIESKRRKFHASNKNIIVFALGEEDTSNTIYQKFQSYINMYCDKEKEASYILEEII